MCSKPYCRSSLGRSGMGQVAYPSRRRQPAVATSGTARACPEVADTPSLDLDLPMDANIAEVFRLVEASEVAVRFGADGNPLSSVLAKRFGARSQMCLAVHPKIGKPFTFGLDQCESPADLDQAGAGIVRGGRQRTPCDFVAYHCLLLSRDLYKRARPGWKKLSTRSHMWGTGTGTLKRM